jgi:hypothetical protein
MSARFSYGRDCETFALEFVRLRYTAAGALIAAAADRSGRADD